MGRRQADRGSVILWAMFCWETLGPGFHVDVTLTCTTCLNILQTKYTPSWQLYSLILFQQDNVSCHTAKIVQEWFEEHDKEFKVLTWPPNSPDLNLIEHLWDVLDKQVRAMKAELATYRT